MKKFVALLLVVLLASLCCAALADESDDWMWAEARNNQMGFTPYSDSDYVVWVQLPYEVNTDAAAIIANKNPNLTVVTLPYELDGKPVEQVLPMAFDFCTKLTQINVSDNQSTFESIDGVLYHAPTKTLICYPQGKTDSDPDIPLYTQAIGPFAFNGNPYLEMIHIPVTVSSIGAYAFRNCSNLRAIDIPESVTSIGQGAFEGCDNPTFFVSKGSYAEQYCIENKLPHEYPIGVEWVDEDTDNWRYGLVYADEIPVYPYLNNGTRYMVTPLPAERGAMNIVEYLNTTATKVALPYELGNKPVVRVVPFAFGECVNLTKIVVQDYRSPFASIDGVLYHKATKTLICYPQARENVEFTIPYGIRAIDHFAFWGSRNLMSVTIPASVTSIGQGAFGECSNLLSITIPDSVTTIASDAFIGCTNKHIVVHVSKDSYAQQYCKENNLPYDFLVANWLYENND